MKLRGAAGSLGLAFLLWAPVCVLAQEEGSPSKTPVLTSPDVPGVPSGFVVVNEDDVQILVEGIESDFRKAQDENAAGRSVSAAHNLRKAAAAIRLEASRAPRSDRNALTAASDSVEALAAALKDGRTESPPGIRHVAGIAHRALSQHLLRMADRAWQKNDVASTGEELETSLDHYAAAVDWMKGGVAGSLAEKYEQWRQLAGVLRRGEIGWTANQVRSALDGLRAELLDLKS